MLANMLKAANKRSSPAFMDRDSPAARGLLDMRTNMRSDDHLLEYKKKSVRRLCTSLRPDSVSKKLESLQIQFWPLCLGFGYGQSKW